MFEAWSVCSCFRIFALTVQLLCVLSHDPLPTLMQVCKKKKKTGLLNFCFYHNNCLSSSKAAIFLYSLSWLIFILHRVKRMVPSLGCILGESEKFVGFWFLGNLGILRNSEKFSVILLSSEWSSGDKVRSGSMTDSSYYLKCFPKIYLKFLSFFPENSRIILTS